MTSHTTLPSRRIPPGRHQRGAATLIVVMVLFFIVALVAVYTNRNLMFEQRTSANQYRSTQAFEAAQAGIDWTVAMLNGGRIDDDCLPTDDETKSTFRARYIDSISAAGVFVLKTQTGGAALMPACVYDASTTSWKCKCPSDAAAAVPSVAATSERPMFRIRLELPADVLLLPPSPATPETSRRDVIRIVSAGCTRPDPNCLLQVPIAPDGDALATVTSVVALRSGLSTPPAGAVTARLDIASGSGPLSAINTDQASNGVTLIAGGLIPGVGTSVLPTSLPGTPAATSVIESDSALSGFGTGDRMFGALLGMGSDLYRLQPSAVRIDCTGGCNSATVNTAARQRPGSVLWLAGDLTVDGDIGTAPIASTSLLASEVPPSGPVMMVVTGTTTLSSGTVYGLIYGRAADWNRGSGAAQVRGALIAEGRLSGTGTQTVVYDAAILNWLRTRHGSFVKVPGGWKDF